MVCKYDKGWTQDKKILIHNAEDGFPTLIVRSRDFILGQVNMNFKQYYTCYFRRAVKIYLNPKYKTNLGLHEFDFSVLMVTGTMRHEH